LCESLRSGAVLLFDKNKKSIRLGILLKTIPNVYNMKKSKKCQCATCKANYNKRRKCTACGRRTVVYVHAIGWECLGKNCPSRNLSVEDLIMNFKSKNNE